MRARVAPAMAVALLLLPPTAAGYGEEGTTSTGDVDAYVGLPGFMCFPAFGDTRVTLTLLDPAPGDAVLLAVQYNHAPHFAGAAVATYTEPSVSVPASWNGCSLLPTSVAVAGLWVDGERPYRLTWG
jgi:hypothetical protein